MSGLKISQEEAITRIAEVFRCHGYEGTSLSMISEATGLGRASLYHRFPGGKEDMALGVLKLIQQQLESEVLVPLRNPGEPRHRVEEWAESVSTLYSGGRSKCLLGVLSLGGSSDRFAAQLGRAFSTWIDALAPVLIESGIAPSEALCRSKDAVSMIQGALIVSRSLNEVGYFQGVVRRLPDSLLSDD